MNFDAAAREWIGIVVYRISYEGKDFLILRASTQSYCLATY